METDKYTIYAQVINRLENRLRTLRTTYICELIEEFMYDIKKEKWINSCVLKKCNNGTYILSDSNKLIEIIAYGNGDIYIGSLDNNLDYLGKSVHLSYNGDVFVGDFKQGEKSHCFGNIEYANGQFKKNIEFGPKEMYESGTSDSFLRSSNFFTRIFCDKAIGRIDFLLVSMLLLIIEVLTALWVFNSDSIGLTNIKICALLFLQVIIPLLGLFFYIKRCRDCRIGFFGGLLILIFCFPIIILYFYKGQLAMRKDYLNEAAKRVCGPEDSSPKVFDCPSATAEELADRLHNRQGYPMKETESSIQNDDNIVKNDKINKKQTEEERDNCEIEHQKQAAERIKNEELVYYLRFQYQQLKFQYEVATKEAENAERAAETEQYYANDEKNKFDLYKEEAALDRAREYEENARNYLREARQKKDEADKYKYDIDDLRKQLANLGEFVQ